MSTYKQVQEKFKNLEPGSVIEMSPEELAAMRELVIMSNHPELSVVPMGSPVDSDEEAPPLLPDFNDDDPHRPGAKLDAGKNRLGLVLGGFKNALKEVGKVGTFGANKYTPNGWKSVPAGLDRYTDALYRHLFASDDIDPESGLDHYAHAAWNILAILEFKMKEAEL